jgi:hypothetical protein
VAENQVDIDRTSVSASSTKARHRPVGFSSRSGITDASLIPVISLSGPVSLTLTISKGIDGADGDTTASCRPL